MAAEDGETRRLERLEYGKLCVRRDGPIEARAESRVLARTAGFPVALEPFCIPSELGAGREVGADVSHATSIRPVVARGRRHVVAYRLRLRPEDGDGGSGRRYWMGRYLAPSAGPLDPWAVHEAFAEGLAGLSRADLDLAAGALGPSARPTLVAGDRRFLLPALVHVMSGVPIGIRAPVNEAVFFRLAAGLWWLLPPALRGLVSVGYGVSEALAASSTFSCARQLSPSTAVFDVQRGVWQPPDAFDERLLGPGRAYVAAAFPRNAEGRPVLVELNPRLDLPSGAPPAWAPDRDGPVPFAGGADAVFRALGEQCREEGRYAQLCKWLNGAPTDDGERVWISASDYADPARRTRIVEQAVEALASLERRGRANRVLWASARADPGVAADLARGPSARARLFAAIACEHPKVLDALRCAAEAGVAEALPDDATAALAELLDRGAKQPDAPLRHAEVLAAGPVSGPYRAWACASVEALCMLLFSAPEPPRSAALSAFAALTGSQTPGVIARLAAMSAPEPGDAERLAAMSARLLSGVDDGLAQRWRLRGLDGAARERLLSWILLRPALLPDDLVVRFARGDESVFSGSAGAVLAAADKQAISLASVAGGVLRERRDPLWAAAGSDSTEAGLVKTRLLLDLFAGDDLIPSPVQVAALTPAPPWLHAHVRRGDVHVDRARRFAMCLAGFQGVDYADSGSVHWRDHWSQSHVWIVFRHLPMNLRGDLGMGLAAFAGDAAHRETRLARARRWFDNEAGEGDTETSRDACRRVAKDVLLPLWLEAGADMGELRRLCAWLRSGPDRPFRPERPSGEARLYPAHRLPFRAPRRGGAAPGAGRCLVSRPPGRRPARARLDMAGRAGAPRQDPDPRVPRVSLRGQSIGVPSGSSGARAALDLHSIDIGVGDLHRFL